LGADAKETYKGARENLQRSKKRPTKVGCHLHKKMGADRCLLLVVIQILVVSQRERRSAGTGTTVAVRGALSYQFTHVLGHGAVMVLVIVLVWIAVGCLMVVHR